MLITTGASKSQNLDGNELSVAQLDEIAAYMSKNYTVNALPHDYRLALSVPRNNRHWAWLAVKGFRNMHIGLVFAMCSASAQHPVEHRVAGILGHEYPNDLFMSQGSIKTVSMGTLYFDDNIRSYSYAAKEIYPLYLYTF